MRAEKFSSLGLDEIRIYVFIICREVRELAKYQDLHNSIGSDTTLTPRAPSTDGEDNLFQPSSMKMVISHSKTAS